MSTEPNLLLNGLCLAVNNHEWNGTNKKYNYTLSFIWKKPLAVQLMVMTMESASWISQRNAL